MVWEQEDLSRHDSENLFLKGWVEIDKASTFKRGFNKFPEDKYKVHWKACRRTVRGNLSDDQGENVWVLVLACPLTNAACTPGGQTT